MGPHGHQDALISLAANTLYFTYTYLRPSLGTNGHPIRPRDLRMRPQGISFMLLSSLMLLDLEISLKNEKTILEK